MKNPGNNDGDTVEFVRAMVWSRPRDGFVEFLNGRWLDYTGSRSMGQVAGGGTRLFNPMIAAH
jgi:hypothetical protein